jgi:hypothetical protein
MQMQIKKYVKTIMPFLVVGFIAAINFKCLMMPIPEMPMKIESSIVESNKQLNGKIGFCGIFSDEIPEWYVPPSLLYMPEVTKLENIYLIGQPLDELQSLFLDSIGNRELTDCNYETLKNFNYRKSRVRYSLLFKRYPFIAPKGYIDIFDEKYEYSKSSGCCLIGYEIIQYEKYVDDKWVMHKDSLRFLNEFFICDYYLTGKVYMSYEKGSGFYHNLLLVIYDNEGYKVWSKIYKNKYSYDGIEGNFMEIIKKQSSMCYENIQRLLNDYKEEINNDLDLLIGSGKD